jgi:hypothetical protein
VVLEYNSGDNTGTLLLGNGNEIEMTNFYHCCGDINTPVVVYPPDEGFNTQFWDAHGYSFYSYGGNGGSMVEGEILQFSPIAISLDTNDDGVEDFIFGVSEFGVFSWNSSTSEFIDGFGESGLDVDVYLDEEGLVGLVIFNFTS